METGRQLIARIASLLGNKAEQDFQVDNFEARVIAENVTGESYSELAINSYELNKHQIEKLKGIVEQRNTGRPLAYVLGSAPFRDLDLFVDERVLIPRSETELVVQQAIDILNANQNSNKTVFDIGTGSGAIALSIAHEIKSAQVYAGDISADAIVVAKLNGVGSGSCASRVNFFQSDLFTNFPEAHKGTVDLIISNPPYIGNDETSQVQDSVIKHEPHLALFSGEFGQDHYRSIIRDSITWLKDSGHLVLEIAPRHIEFMQEQKNINGYSKIDIHADFAKRPRVAIFTK